MTLPKIIGEEPRFRPGESRESLVGRMRAFCDRNRLRIALEWALHDGNKLRALAPAERRAVVEAIAEAAGVELASAAPRVVSITAEIATHQRKPARRVELRQVGEVHHGRRR